MKGAAPHLLGVEDGAAELPMPIQPAPHPRPSRAGFTLIELMVVVIVIGALAAIAVPKYNLMRERAARGLLMSDLRNLATAQEGYHAERRTYSLVQDSLRYQSSSGVVVTIVEATDGGWSAEAVRTGFGSSCVIHHGAVQLLRPGAGTDQIFCD